MITPAMVKELREITGAPMMDCKRALEETNGNMEAAVTKMRERGVAKAAKRAGKIAAEGVIALQVSADHKRAFIAEINCETDFVARDQLFRKFAEVVAHQGLQHKMHDVEALLKLPYEKSDHTIEQTRHELVAKLGENIQIRRVMFIESQGIIGHYKHGDRIGVLVSLDKSQAEMAKDIAMHIVATNPIGIDESSVSKEVLNKEREIYMVQAKDTGKPKEIIEKMVAGRVSKFLKEACLLTQPFVKNPDQTISDLLKTQQAKVQSFVRFEVGEGIEKQEVDFAAEVKAQVQGG